MIKISAKLLLFIIPAVLLFSKIALAESIDGIEIKGNLKVESSAIKSILKSKKGKQLSRNSVADDIKAIFELGYFSDVRVYKTNSGSGVKLLFEVVEKPSIVEIKFEGLEEVKKEDLDEKLSTKLYTILDESTISADLRLIEKSYAEKGFFLAKATYEAKNINKNETAVTFRVQENGKILVGDVHILGNEYFSDPQLTEMMATRPTTRSTVLGSSSLFQEAFVKRDVEFLSYYYQDFGFAEVKVGKAYTEIGVDRQYVDVTFSVEEGTQYWLGDITFSGDLLYSDAELREALNLESGDLFKISKFRRDVDALVDLYGDLGYAYVDVNPKTKFDRKSQKVHVDFQFTKGPKVYFGLMQVVGNSKTRDNVIRRELEIADGDLYSRIGLRDSKSGIERLGFFESVQVIKERDPSDENKLNLKIKVKEKPTGQLQAAIGYTPSGATDASWFGQGRYEEKNQSGKGWNVNFTGKTDGGDNYNLDLGFGDPRLNDSLWSIGANLGYEQRKITSFGIDILEERKSAGARIGRNLFEKVRGSFGLTLRNVNQTTTEYLSDKFKLVGDTISASFTLSRKVVDNYIDPTDGTSVGVTHKFITGDYSYMETEASGQYYIPLSYTETYKTHFKFNLQLGKLSPFEDSPLPIIERYKLGGANDLRAYSPNSITPKFPLWKTPFEFDSLSAFPKGGDRRLLFQGEYFMPLIPQAGIKALLFFDAGRVYDNEEEFEISGLTKDVGFGIRWVTPIAPFRFEWAFPVDEDGKLGKHNLIFNIGY